MAYCSGVASYRFKGDFDQWTSRGEGTAASLTLCYETTLQQVTKGWSPTRNNYIV